MALWRRLRRGLRVLAQRESADREIADEVAHYYEEAAAELEARGLSPAEARLAARRQLGPAPLVREQLRAFGWESSLAALAADLRYAARRLRGDPALAAIGVLTLALGIGASTAIFSAVHPILFAPLPYPHAERILDVWDFGPAGERAPVTFGTYRELLARCRSFAALAVWKPWQPAMTGTAAPERFAGQSVSAGYFRVLGVPPALGRDLDPADDRRLGPRVVILSDSLWRRRFGADRALVGRQVKLDDDAYTVLGVMPPSFENVLVPDAELWTLLQYDAVLPAQGREWGHHLRMVARLRPGVAAAEAGRELAAIARAPLPELPRPRWASLDRGLGMSPLQDDVTRGVRPALLAVLGAVGLLLLIACVNVTNLLLARGAQRRGELAMRTALGAGRGRLLRQLVTESLLLAALGGALGLAVARLGIRAMVLFSPEHLPRVAAVRLDGAVFAFALALTTLTGLAVGLLPALRGSRFDLGAELQQGSRRIAPGHRLIRPVLVMAEVALALMLLVGAGLLWRSMQRLLAVAPGFRTSHLLTLQVQTYGHRYDDDAVTHRFYRQALDAVRHVPGVAAAAFTSQLPLSGESYVPEVYGIHFQNDADPGVSHDGLRCAVSPGYFETMGIPLRRGRLFDDHDLTAPAGAAERPVLLSESFARRKFPGIDPLGQRLRFGGPANRPWDVVAGVVGDVRQTSLAAGQEDSVYVVSDRWLWADSPRWLVVRAAGDAASLAPAVEQAVWSVDKDQPIVRVGTMDALLAASAAQRRFVLTLFAAFALAALALAAIGLYGVMSGSVAERRREIGVRSALGATGGDLLLLVLRQGLALTGLGIALGLAGTLLASRALAALLFGVSRLDPVTHLDVIALLIAISAVACWVPAWRAARVDPSITLRTD